MASVYDYSQATDILSVISDGSNSDDDEVKFDPKFPHKLGEIQ